MFLDGLFLTNFRDNQYYKSIVSAGQTLSYCALREGLAVGIRVYNLQENWENNKTNWPGKFPGNQQRMCPF